MAHPEIVISWVSFFLRASGMLIVSRAENADFAFDQQKSAFICVKN